MFATLPQTSVSLRQMTRFGREPDAGTLIRATQFMRDELTIRLAHRVKELEKLPHGLDKMSSVVRVKDWYTLSFQDLITFPHPSISRIPDALVLKNIEQQPERDYFDSKYVRSDVNNSEAVIQYNAAFSKCLEKIKRRHDPVVTTIAQGIIELKNKWKTENNARQDENLPLPLEIQSFLDR